MTGFLAATQGASLPHMSSVGGRLKQSQHESHRVQEGPKLGMRVERLDHLGIVAGICRDPHFAASVSDFVEFLAGRPQ